MYIYFAFKSKRSCIIIVEKKANKNSKEDNCYGCTGSDQNQKKCKMIQAGYDSEGYS